MTYQFKAFPKITRYENANVVITEKIDGTNACIAFDDDGTLLGVQSRKRLIRPDALDGNGSDNFGFAHYVHTHEKKLWQFFGPGRHYGEWFGAGIQRSYGMTDRVFAPFNTSLYTQERVEAEAPEGITYTPVIGICQLDELPLCVKAAADQLRDEGSQTREGRGWEAEGLMLFSLAWDGFIKHPFESGHKGQR